MTACHGHPARNQSFQALQRPFKICPLHFGGISVDRRVGINVFLPRRRTRQRRTGKLSVPAVGVFRLAVDVAFEGVLDPFPDGVPGVQAAQEPPLEVGRFRAHKGEQFRVDCFLTPTSSA